MRYPTWLPPEDWEPPILTAQVVGADGDVYTLATDLGEAQEIAAAWNAETRPHERSHAGAYPFRAEMRI